MSEYNVKDSNFMNRGSKIFFLFFFLLILSSIIFAAYKFTVLRDFGIFTGQYTVNANVIYTGASNAVAQLIQDCNWSESKYLLFSGNVFDPLVYYSHFVPIILSLILGFFILLGSGRLDGKILFFIFLGFIIWLFSDLVLWATERSSLVMFFWTLEVIIEPLIYAASFYFVQVFILKNDTSVKTKALTVLALLPIIVFASSRYSLLAFNLSNCDREAMEGPLVRYAYFVEIIFSLSIIFYATKKYLSSVAEQKKQIFFVTIGVSFFLLTLSFGNIVGSFSDNWQIGQYGLFGMPIFAAFLVFMIVKYKAFNIKLLAAQALVVGMIILIGSEFFFIKVFINQILTAITLVLVTIFGWWLVKSVKAEVAQREQLALANEGLKKLDESKNEFINIASHQLRTPVTVLRGVISMLRDGTIDKFDQATKNKFYDGAWFKCQKLEDIINDILNATSLINRKYSAMDGAAEPVVLKELFEKMIADFGPAVTEREITLKLNLKDPTLEIRAQRRYLEEAFSNLLTNAIKYTPSPKQTEDVRNRREGEALIQISAEKKGEHVLISIKDNGIGIPPEAMPKLFQKFSRAENAVDMYTDGTGLGLFIVKEIVEGHGGRVWVESELNKGSTFFVELPLNPQGKIDIKEYIIEKAKPQE